MPAAKRPSEEPVIAFAAPVKIGAVGEVEEKVALALAETETVVPGAVAVGATEVEF